MQEPFKLRQLRYFLEVADAGNFSRAAKRLGVAQPASSQQMRDLEAGLRAVLLQRRGEKSFPDDADLSISEISSTDIETSLEEGKPRWRASVN